MVSSQHAIPAKKIADGDFSTVLVVANGWLEYGNAQPFLGSATVWVVSALCAKRNARGLGQTGLESTREPGWKLLHTSFSRGEKRSHHFYKVLYQEKYPSHLFPEPEAVLFQG